MCRYRASKPDKWDCATAQLVCVFKDCGCVFMTYLGNQALFAMCRYRASEPDKWDYAAAGVPTPLTDELEGQQQAKQVPLLACLATCQYQL